MTLTRDYFGNPYEITQPSPSEAEYVIFDESGFGIAAGCAIERDPENFDSNLSFTIKNCLEGYLNLDKSSWEHIAGRNFGKVKCLEELMAKLNDPNPSIRILACRIAGACYPLYNTKQKKIVKEGLTKKLSDDSLNEVYGSFQCEDEEIYRVKDAAKKTLEGLEL